MMTENDTIAIRALGQMYDPDIACAERGCDSHISFKMHWVLRICHRADSMIDPGTTRDDAFQWWLQRSKMPWYCEEHDKV
jgi:hypothetical protein